LLKKPEKLPVKQRCLEAGKNNMFFYVQGIVDLPFFGKQVSKGIVDLPFFGKQVSKN